MKPTPQAIENAARAIELRRADLIAKPLSRIYADLAQAALSADLGDMVLVPKEPTPEMLDAVDSRVVGCCNMTDADSAEVYRAMIAAAEGE